MKLSVGLAGRGVLKEMIDKRNSGLNQTRYGIIRPWRPINPYEPKRPWDQDTVSDIASGTISTASTIYKMMNDFKEESKPFKLDLTEYEDHYLVEAEISGAKEEDFNISMDGEDLIIQVTFEETKTDGKVLIGERKTEQLERAITLSKPINMNEAEAGYDNGILRITLPKLPEIKARTIPVKRR